MLALEREINVTLSGIGPHIVTSKQKGIYRSHISNSCTKRQGNVTSVLIYLYLQLIGHGVYQQVLVAPICNEISKAHIYFIILQANLAPTASTSNNRTKGPPICNILQI
jgi:hypothetical protein